MKTTKAPRGALVRVYRRIVSETALRDVSAGDMAFTYRAFRRTVQPGPGCLMVPSTMWLGKERPPPAAARRKPLRAEFTRLTPP